MCKAAAAVYLFCLCNEDILSFYFLASFKDVNSFLSIQALLVIVNKQITDFS